mgnify:CR=1 FL=1
MKRQHPLRTADYLQHVAQAIDNIQSYTVGMDAADFKADRKTQDAVIRNLQTLAESSQRLSGDIKATEPQMPSRPLWRLKRSSRAS